MTRAALVDACAAVVAAAGMLAAPTLTVTPAAAATAAAGGARGASPPPPAVATIRVNRACYVNRTAHAARMTITGTGFTPGDQVSISGGTSYAQADAGPTGSFTVTTAAPELSSVGPGTLSTILTATDANAATGQTITATRRVRSTNLAVALSPSSIPARQIPRRKISYSFSGFTPGHHIYGYWLRRRVVATTRFGRARGPCGTLTQRARLYPGGHPRRRVYRVAFQSSDRYRRRAHPSVVGRLSIMGF